KVRLPALVVDDVAAPAPVFGPLAQLVDGAWGARAELVQWISESLADELRTVSAEERHTGRGGVRGYALSEARLHRYRSRTSDARHVDNVGAVEDPGVAGLVPISSVALGEPPDHPQRQANVHRRGPQFPQPDPETVTTVSDRGHQVVTGQRVDEP